MQKHTINQVKQLPREIFIETFGAIFEHTPVIAQYVFDKYHSELNTVQSVEELKGVFDKALEYHLSQNEENGLKLIREHPKLGVAKLSSISTQSQSEQKSVGLTDVSEEEVKEFHRMNDAYSDKFGFPFIVCVREQKRKEAILNAFKTRLQSESVEQEKRTALGEIKKIAMIRLSDLVVVDSNLQQ